MSKQKIFRLWLAGEGAAAAAVVFMVAGGIGLLAHLDAIGPGRTLTYVDSPYTRRLLAVAAFGGLLFLFGLAAQFVAWIAAVNNTRRSTEQRWADLMLWGGVGAIVTAPMGLGIFVMPSLMIAYFVDGPDSTAGVAKPAIVPKPELRRQFNRGLALFGFGGLFAIAMPILSRPGLPLHGHAFIGLLLAATGISAAIMGFIPLAFASWGSVFNAEGLEDKRSYLRLRTMAIVATVTASFFGVVPIVMLFVVGSYLRSDEDGAKMVTGVTEIRHAA